MSRFHRLDHWCRRQCPPHALALVRIAWGCWALFYVGRYIPHLRLLFSSEGVTLPLYSGLAPQWMTFAIEAPSFPMSILLFSLLLVSLVSFTIGYRMRLAAVLSILLSLYFWQLSVHMFFATFHRLYLVVFLVFFFSGADRTFSVWAKMNKGSYVAWDPISILPQRILALQLTITYIGSGFQKMVLPGWADGSVLRYSFMSAWATPLARWIAQQPLPLSVYDAAVQLIKYFEWSLPFGLWFKKTQWWFFVGGALFHIAIAFLLSIWSFLILIPFYILFLEPEEVQKWVTSKKRL